MGSRTTCKPDREKSCLLLPPHLLTFKSNHEKCKMSEELLLLMQGLDLVLASAATVEGAVKALPC